MANNKLLTDISNNVKEIKDIKKFGTKLPSNGNKADEQTIQELAYDQMIMGTLASLVWGKQNISKEDQVKSLLGNQINIFGLVESIKQSIENNIPQLSQAIINSNANIEKVPDKIEAIKTALVDFLEHQKEHGNEQLIKIELSSLNGLESLDKFVETLNELNGDGSKNIIDTLNNINLLLRTLGSKEYKINSDLIEKNVKNISKVLSGKTIESLKGIIKQLTQLNKDKVNEDVVNSVSSVASLFSTLSRLGEFDKDKLKQLKSNLKYIKKYIIGSIIDIIEEFIEAVNDVKEDAYKVLDSINDLFDHIFKIIDYSFKDLLFLDLKLQYLSHILSDSLIGADENSGIIVTMSTLSDKFDLDKAIENTEKLNNLIDNIGDIISNEKLSLKNIALFLIKMTIISLTSEWTLKCLDDLRTIINKAKTISITDNQFKTFYNAIKLLELLANAKINVAKVFMLKKSLRILDGIVDLIGDICTHIEEKDIDVQQLSELIGITNKFTEVIGKLGLMLLLGGIIMTFVKPGKLITFAVTLGAFVWGITKILKKLSGSIETAIKIGDDAFKLIGICGGILLLGGIIMKLIKPGDLILFAITLGVFILLISTAFLILNKAKDTVIESAYEFALLIAITAGSLLLGALFMKSGLWEQAIYFGIGLIIFVTAITWAYSWASKGMEDTMGAAINLAVIIGISTLALTIGALFVLNPKLLLGAAVFAIILGAFIVAIVKVMAWADDKIKTSIESMIGLSILVAIAAGTLLIGALMFKLVPNLFMNTIVFILALTIFVGAMAGICWLLKVIKEHIEDGIEVFFGLTILMGLATVVMGLVAIVSFIASKVGFVNIWHTLGIMAITFGILGVICFVLGQPEIAAVVGLGIVVMLGMTILLFAMAGAMAALVAVIKYASTISEKQLDTLFGKEFFSYGTIGHAIIGLIKLAPLFSALSVAAIAILPGCAVLLGLSVALSSLALTIQTWSNLRIPIYDDHGKLTGYKTIDDTDFQQAGENIKKVITCIIGAVIEAYRGNEDMFSLTWESIFTFGKTPFQRVVSSLQGTGKMLSEIASGIKAWTNLKIPEYDGKGKIKGYQTLSDSDFAKAGENIKAVITALGEAIIETYRNAPPGMFDTNEWFGFGDTPFAKVTKSMKTMGPMLSSIAKGVQTWADLKIPIYKGDKVVGYERLEGTALTKAQSNIIAVTTALAEAIIEVYNEAPEGMFEDDSWLGLGDTPFARVTKGMKSMGNALTNIAEGVEKWAELKIPIYGDKKDATKITGYKTIDNSVFRTVASNIKYVVTMLANAIASLAKDPKYGKLFTDEDWWSGDTDVAKVLKSIQPLGSSLKDIADALVLWSDMKIPIYGDEKNPTKITGWYKLTNQQLIDTKDNIKEVVTGLFEAIKNTYDQNKDYFNRDLFASDSKIGKVLNAMKPLGEALSQIGKSLQLWAELKIPVYGGGLEPTGYLSIGDKNGITTATDNIKAVLRAMVVGIASVYYGKIKVGGKEYEYKDLFDDEIISKFSDQMVDASKMLSNLAKGIQSIVELKMPVYDKNGKIISYTNLSKGDFSKVSEVISSVVNALGEAFVKASTYDIGDKNFKPLIESFKASTDTLNSMASVIANFATGKFVVYGIKNNKLVPIKTIDISDSKIQAKVKKNISNIFTILTNAINGMTGNNAFVTSLNSYIKNKNMKTIVTNISNLTNQLVEIIKKVSAFGKIYEENTKQIETFVNGNVAESIKNIAGVIKEIIDQFIETEFQEKLINITQYYEIYQKHISSLSLINTLAQKLIEVANNNEKVKDLKFDNLSTAITNFKTSLESFEEIDVNLSSKISEISTFIETIDSIKNILTFTDKVNTLKDGILNLNQIYKQVDSKKNIKQHVEDLKKYVNTINSIQLNKISTLKEFVDSLNALSDRLGNLDELTNAIANNLSSVLYELVQQLAKADVSINNAHELQEKRKKLIEDSIKNIQEIMGQHMIVEISQVDPNATPTGGKDEGSPAETPQGKSGGSSGGSGGGSSDSYTSLNNPENATGKSIVQGKQKQNNNMDLEAFKAWMLTTYKTELADSIKQKISE